MPYHLFSRRAHFSFHIGPAGSSTDLGVSFGFVSHSWFVTDQHSRMPVTYLQITLHQMERADGQTSSKMRGWDVEASVSSGSEPPSFPAFPGLWAPFQAQPACRTGLLHLTQFSMEKSLFLTLFLYFAQWTWKLGISLLPDPSWVWGTDLEFFSFFRKSFSPTSYHSLFQLLEPSLGQSLGHLREV